MDRNAIETTTLTDSLQETTHDFVQLIEEADNLARDGDLGPAYSVYLRASRHKEFKPFHLTKLIDCLVENLKMAHQKSNDLLSLITCEICYRILIDPVTIDCGHTFCNACLTGLVNCAICSTAITPDFNRKFNVLLIKLLKSWLPEYKAVLDRRKILEQLLSNKMYNECLDFIEEALRSGFERHHYLSERSQIHLEMGKIESALRDAETVVRLQPNWIKSHYRLGEILARLGYTEEAIKSYITGLSLNPDNPDLKEIVSQQMYQFVRTSTPEEALKCGALKANMVRQRAPNSNVEDSPDDVKGKFDVAPLPIDEIKCSLCWKMLFEPSTTCCGHTFCKECLKRSLDHSADCPLCKSSLEQILRLRLFSTDKVVEQVIKKFYPKDYSENLSEMLADSLVTTGVNDQEMKVPIFVCVLTFPGVRCPLHIFEPRYRLMIRRCIENGSRKFGMVRGTQNNSYADIGTLLLIEDVKYLPDGRSLITTTGSKRFKVLNREYVDGYNVADIRILEDEPIPPIEEQETRALHDKVLNLSRTWMGTLTDNQRTKIQQQFGLFPNTGPTEEEVKEKDGPLWLWWLISILPIDERGKINLLERNNLPFRLRSVESVLNVLANRQQQR